MLYIPGVLNPNASLTGGRWLKTSAYKIQMPGNHPEENIQHTEHGESLK
jgi:hypothetical protein